MKKLLCLLSLLLIASPTMAASLAWDHPAEWEIIEGYTVYFTTGTEEYTKTLAKIDVETDGAEVRYVGIEEKLSLEAGVQYAFHLTAFNSQGESGPSNTVEYTHPAHTPPEDNLPIVITVPGPATIKIYK